MNPSWEEETRVFCDSVLEGKPILSGTSLDALNTMKLVYKIYYADSNWRKSYKIQNPDE